MQDGLTFIGLLPDNSEQHLVKRLVAFFATGDEHPRSLQLYGVDPATVGAAAFGRPVLRTNLPFEHLNLPYNDDLSLFKHYRRAGDRRLLRYREILLWHTENNMGNAAVVGLVPRLRYILLSDLLLETMDDRQIEAVFAHEIGHIVHEDVAESTSELVEAMQELDGFGSL